MAAPPPPPPPPRPFAAPPPRPNEFKGKLVATGRAVPPPLHPAAGYVFGAAVGVMLVVLGVSMQSQSRGGIQFATTGLMLCGMVLVAVLLSRIPRTVRFYEFGIETSMPRRLTSAWLPWSAVVQYSWDRDMLRYTWDRNAGIPPLFPAAARVPSELVSDVSALVRSHAPPPRPR